MCVACGELRGPYEGFDNLCECDRDLPERLDEALADIRAWQELGITHVVDNRMEWDDSELVTLHAPGIRYLHNGIDDIGQEMPDEWFDAGVGFVLAALSEPDTKVLVHCHMGINRGPSLAYASLLALDWDPIEAMTAIRSVRPIAAVGYAGDALDWHHRAWRVSRREQLDNWNRLEQWHEASPIDVIRIIRQIRLGEAS
jgi:protein-tyrosine phosphatase